MKYSKGEGRSSDRFVKVEWMTKYEHDSVTVADSD